ncbi:unnamed protein product [Soboliphyme baturini]|uniref:Uncharacterized protein n=1 Tax=Soboliphyme baturini TaxID=241478 RepID=A0A183IRB0_9BILA|nr:unnamed protein product [Soboliphyme baturini]
MLLRVRVEGREACIMHHETLATRRKIPAVSESNPKLRTKPSERAISGRRIRSEHFLTRPIAAFETIYHESEMHVPIESGRL